MLDYTYGGQWFDDMGSLALYFAEAPATGVDIARSGLTRSQANDMAGQMKNAGVTGYEDDTMPQI